LADIPNTLSKLRQAVGVACVFSISPFKPSWLPSSWWCSPAGW